MGHTFANVVFVVVVGGVVTMIVVSNIGGGGTTTTDDDDDTEPTKRHKYCAIILIDNKSGVGHLKAKIKCYRYLRIVVVASSKANSSTAINWWSAKRCGDVTR